MIEVFLFSGLEIQNIQAAGSYMRFLFYSNHGKLIFVLFVAARHCGGVALWVRFDAY